MKRLQCLTGRTARLGKRLASLLCAGALAMSGLLPLIPPAHAQGELPRLNNLILDKVYSIRAVEGYPGSVEPNDTGFAPEVTDYFGTAYASVDKVRVYPFADASAKVTVNDKELKDGYVELDVSKLGEYPVTVKVTEGGASNTYTVNVNKTDTDYRGRIPAVKNEKVMNALSVKSSVGDETQLMKILKKDYMVSLKPNGQANGSYADTQESYWSVDGSKLPDEAGKKPATELFTVDLGDVYSISRIRAAFGPSNLSLGKNKARISVSTDGEHWETPVTKGNMNTGVQFHQNVTRYEFGVSYNARYIRFEVTHWQYPDKDLRLYQFMIFTDSGKVPDKQPAPEGASVPYQHEERHQYLASGQATVIERGFPMLGWTPSSGYGRGTPTVEEARQFGYDGPLFYDPDFANADYMLYNPNSLWGIAKAPFGDNAMGKAGLPREFVPQSMQPYIRNAVSFCFGDEGAYSKAEAEALGKWYDWTRQHYPAVILHTNQYSGLWQENNLREYMSIAQPDMLTWDDYYGDQNWARPSSFDLSTPGVQKNAARRCLNMWAWDTYRKLADGGIDGTGSKPILFGQYLDAFAFNHSQSNKNLVVNTSILSGMKWLNFFRVEYQFDRAYLWDEDGTPTRGLLEWGRLIDRVHAIDGQLTRLDNDWIMFKVGAIGSQDDKYTVAAGYRRGDFDAPDSKAKNREFGIADVTMKSLSAAHEGKTGDVVLGYFNTLPGLYENEIAEYFAGSTAPKAFMVMNGLVAGKAERYNSFNIPAREAGSSANTRQEITITADPAFVEAGYRLYEVDKDDSGRLKQVELNDGSFTVTLGGGEANLYFWAINTTASATSQTDGTYASFAFDGHPETFWRPAGEAESYALENTFPAASLDEVTVTENGTAIREMTIEYKDLSGEWQTFGTASNEEGVWSCSAAPVEATALRVRIDKAEGLPAIYEVAARTADIDPEGVSTITVNDNTMGSGLFRFQYDSLWSYRETESNASAMDKYPLQNDGHYSNWKGARATFTFYGTGVELLLRADQAKHIRAAITGEGEGEPAWQTGKENVRSLVFTGLNPGVHTLTIEKLDDQQAGIDGAKVTYTGALPKNITAEHSKGLDAVQEYVDQRTTNTNTLNHFVYDQENIPSKPIGDKNQGFDADVQEAEGWVQHLQDARNHNLGFTRTRKEGATYSVQFYGTAVQLYAGVTPMGDKNNKDAYGELTFLLDGEKVEPQTIPTGDLGKNGKVSARMWRIAVPDAKQNDSHLLKVTVSGGYNRVDYAVVERMWQNEPSADSYSVTVAASENGKAELLTSKWVQAGGNAVVRITPNEGYQAYRILVNNVSQNLPKDGRLFLTNIRRNTSVQVSFAPASYDIRLDPGEGGVVTPSSLKAAGGETVSLCPQAFAGYRMREDSLQVTTSDGEPVVLNQTDDGMYTFEMPDGSVLASARFDRQKYPVQITGELQGGSLVTTAAADGAFYRDTITVNVQPQDGMRLTEGSLKVRLDDGSILMPDANVDGSYTFVMPAQGVTLQAAFEQIPDHTVTASAGEMGKVECLTPGVMDGAEARIRMLPEEQYMVGSITVNGQPWPVPAEGDELVIANVTADLKVEVAFVGSETTMHTVTFTAGEGGTVSPAAQKVADGGVAVFLPAPASGYAVERVFAGERDAEKNEANGSYQLRGVTQGMEAQAAFTKILYAVQISQAENGTITASADKAAFGEEITVTVKPAEGYYFRDGSLQVAAGDAQQSVQAVKAGETYTFRMPDREVTVTGSFDKIAEPKPEPKPDPMPDPKPQPESKPTVKPDTAPAPDAKPTQTVTSAPAAPAAPAAPVAPASPARPGKTSTATAKQESASTITVKPEAEDSKATAKPEETPRPAEKPEEPSKPTAAPKATEAPAKADTPAPGSGIPVLPIAGGALLLVVIAVVIAAVRRSRDR